MVKYNVGMFNVGMFNVGMLSEIFAKLKYSEDIPGAKKKRAKNLVFLVARARLLYDTALRSSYVGPPLSKY
jgi:hypothetical protein